MTLAAIPRPDGRLYRPRKIVAYCWDNDQGVLVLGTHDVDRARQLAVNAVHLWFDRDMTAGEPKVGWWRLGYTHQGQVWLRDEVRGRAGVSFTAIYSHEVTG